MALDSADIHYFLNRGDVDFKKSDTKAIPCKTFVIAADVKEREIFMTISNCEDKVIVENLTPGN